MSGNTIHAFLTERVSDLIYRNRLDEAAALQELIETHWEGFGIRTDFAVPKRRWWWSQRMRDAHLLDRFGPVCVFCSEVVDGHRQAGGFPCPVLMGAAEAFRDRPGWQASWEMVWADWS